MLVTAMTYTIGTATRPNQHTAIMNLAMSDSFSVLYVIILRYDGFVNRCFSKLEILIK